MASESAKGSAVFLYTSVPKDVTTEMAQRAMLDVLMARGVRVVRVDGADAANKDVRAALWAVSGRRAVYPQLFVRAADGGAHEFVGDSEAFTMLVENNEARKGLDALVARTT